MSQVSGTSPVADEAASNEWGVTGSAFSAGKRFVVVELLLLPALPIALVGFLFWGFAGLVVALLVAVAALLLWALVLRPPLRTLRPRAVRGDEAVRVQNLIEGLSRDLDRPPPSLLVIESTEPNAYVARRLGSEFVAVTTGLLDGYARTEQEAVAAHCLVRLRSAPLAFSTMAAAAGKWAFAHAPRVGQEDDLAAVTVTRYPPALASAIEKAGSSLAEAPLAFSSDAGCHRTAAARRAALLDL